MKKPILLDETGRRIVEELEKMSGKSTIDNSAISDSYNELKSYGVGDFCIYNNKLYICTEAIKNGESWEPDHWKETSVSEVILILTKEVDRAKKAEGANADNLEAMRSSIENYSLVDFVKDKIQYNTNDDYLHTYLVGGVTYVFSGDTTYKSFRDISDNNTILSTANGTKDDTIYTPEKSGMYCLRWYKAANDNALKTLKLTCSIAGEVAVHFRGVSELLNENIDGYGIKTQLLKDLPTGTWNTAKWVRLFTFQGSGTRVRQYVTFIYTNNNYGDAQYPRISSILGYNSSSPWCLTRDLINASTVSDELGYVVNDSGLTEVYMKLKNYSVPSIGFLIAYNVTIDCKTLVYTEPAGIKYFQ